MAQLFGLVLAVTAALTIACSGDDPAATVTPKPAATLTRVPPATATPAPTATPPALQLAPQMNDELLQGRLAAVHPTDFALYVVDIELRHLRRLGLSGPWSPAGPLIAGVRCCGPDLRGFGVVDLGRMTAFELGAEDGEVDAWSPSGEAFLFRKRANSGQTVATYLVEADGSGAQTLNIPESAIDIRWRPASGQIAYDSPAGVFLFDIAAGTSTRLSPPTLDGYSALGGWSPDGRYLSITGTSARLLEVDTMRTVTLPGDGRVVSWPNAGNGFAYMAYDEVGRTPRLYLLDASDLAGPEVVLPASSVTPYSFSWSPDGRYLAYVNNGCRGGGWSIHRLEVATGTDVTLLSNNSLVRLGIQWSSDGRYLAYAGYGPSVGATSPRGVYVFDLWQGAEQKLITVPPQLSTRISGWSSDGRYLNFSATGGFGICDG